MSIPSFSVKQPVLVNLIVILILVGGTFSYRNMAKDRFPDVSVEMIMVQTIMPGASPKEIEQLITTPLEEEIAKVDEIDSIVSVSSEGASIIAIELEAGVADVFEKLTEIQNQIELVQGLPTQAENPIVTEIKIAFDTITIGLVGSAPEHEVKRFADDLEDELKSISGVEEVRIDGLRDREIWIEVDPFRLNAYRLSLADVTGAVRRRNLNLPGGLIRMGRGEFVVRTEAEYHNLEEILDTVINESEEGGFVFLRDVATVANTFEERKTLARLDGESSINLVVKKDKKSNALTVVEEVRKVAAEFEARLPAGLSMKLVDDSSVEIRDRLNSLYGNLSLGLVLVVFTFTVFIGWRAALMVAAGLPVAFLATFVFMNAYGYTINLMSLFSLILVLGLVVDDAIVVCENVYRHMEMGVPLKEAAVKGTEEITMPVIATVLTTIAAFLPLLLMGGVLGKFMGIIPVVVSLALAASLVECLFILPAHISEWGASRDSAQAVHKSPAWVKALAHTYSRIVSVVLTLRYGVVALTMVVGFSCLWIAQNRMDFILFGGRDLRYFTLAVEAPPGASLEETARILRQLEDRAIEILPDAPEIKHIRTRVGGLSTQRMNFASGSNIGEIGIELVKLSERERMGQAVKNQLRENIQDVSGARTLTFEDAREGPPVGKPVQIRVRGDNFETLKEISDQVQAYLATIDGVKDIKDNFPPGKDEIRPVLDLERVAMLDLNVRSIANEVRAAFDGVVATTIHDGEEEVDVVVKYDAQYRRSIADLSEMQFSTPMGMVPFSNFGKIERRKGFSSITHYDQKRSISVLADVVTEGEGATTSQAVNLAAIEAFSDIPERYPGYTLTFGGEYQDTGDSLADLQRSFIITIILIYVILGSLFSSFIQPLIVMFAVPFSFIGAIVGFYILDEPLGMMAIIGVIALAGIVVNDSLIFIEFINQRRRAGVERRQSILDAGAARLRPILLTSITTIFGLMPITLGLFGADPFLRPMALSIVSGLTFSTVLTLIVIPAVYAIADDFSRVVVRRPLGISREQYRQFKEQQAAAEG